MTLMPCISCCHSKSLYSMYITACTSQMLMPKSSQWKSPACFLLHEAKMTGSACRHRIAAQKTMKSGLLLSLMSASWAATSLWNGEGGPVSASTERSTNGQRHRLALVDVSRWHSLSKLAVLILACASSHCKSRLNIWCLPAAYETSTAPCCRLIGAPTPECCIPSGYAGRC